MEQHPRALGGCGGGRGQVMLASDWSDVSLKSSHRSVITLLIDEMSLNQSSFFQAGCWGSSLSGSQVTLASDWLIVS